MATSELSKQLKKETTKSSFDTPFAQDEEQKLLVFPKLAYDERECTMFGEPAPVYTYAAEQPMPF